MGYLYYTDLGNTASTGLTNTGPFNNLNTSNSPFNIGDVNYSYFWSGTDGWAFDGFDGYQHTDHDWDNYYGLAVHSGDVAAGSGADPVPEPSTFLLFGAGIGGVALFRRRMKA
jgi:hypothetical protein